MTQCLPPAEWPDLGHAKDSQGPEVANPSPYGGERLGPLHPWSQPALGACGGDRDCYGVSVLSMYRMSPLVLNDKAQLLV